MFSFLVIKDALLCFLFKITIERILVSLSAAADTPRKPFFCKKKIYIYTIFDKKLKQPLH